MLRRELGQALRAARNVASYSQAQLARKTGYARSTVSTVESGGQNAPRAFWERCDEVLGTGTAFAARYDQLAQQVAACSQTAALGTACVAVSGGRADWGLNAGTVSDAVTAYRELGWQAEMAGGRVELVCGRRGGAGGAAGGGGGGGPLVAAYGGTPG